MQRVRVLVHCWQEDFFKGVPGFRFLPSLVPIRTMSFVDLILLLSLWKTKSATIQNRGKRNHRHKKTVRPGIRQRLPSL